MTLEYSVGPWGHTLDEFVAGCRDAEAAGMARVWNPELHRSPFVPLAAAAAATSSIPLATGIALAFVRSPLSLALTALDMDELCGGRFALGLGTGVRRLNENWHNATFGKPVAHLDETVKILRLVWAEAAGKAPLVFDGQWESLRLAGFERPFHQQRNTIPVFVAAVGPMLTRFAGRVGDGWVAHELGSPQYLRHQVLPQLERGLQQSGRQRSQLRVTASACCVIHPDLAEARRRAAGLVAFYASVRSYTDFFAWHGFRTQALQVQDAFRRGDMDAMIAAVSDDMVDELTVCGPPDRVRRRLAGYEGLADEVKLTPPTHFVTPEVTREAQAAIFATAGNGW